MRINKLITLAIACISLTCQAGKPPLQAWLGVYNVDYIADYTWRVSGSLSDYSALGYSSFDVSVSNLLFSSSDSGVVDVFRVSNVVTQAFDFVEFDVTQATYKWPVETSPGVGKCILCSETNGVVFIPAFVVNQGDEYLARQAQSISSFIMQQTFASVDTNEFFSYLTNWISIQGYLTNTDSFVIDLSMSNTWNIVTDKVDSILIPGFATTSDVNILSGQISTRTARITAMEARTNDWNTSTGSVSSVQGFWLMGIDGVIRTRTNWYAQVDTLLTTNSLGFIVTKGGL